MDARSASDGGGSVRPRLLCSRCLEFDSCRWDGARISDELVRRLVSFVDFVPVCPEVAIGLGVPRDPIRLVRGEAGEVELFQPASGRVLTREMESFAGRFLDGLGEVDGAILKFRSPSCGTSDVRVHPRGDAKGAITGKSPGLFAAAAISRLEGLPVESEGRLKNFAIREHFLTRIFSLAAFRGVRQACLQAGTTGPLVEFHAGLKMLLMAMNREEQRRLGRLLASGLPVRDALQGYGEGLRHALARPMRPGAVVDVLLHALGFFKDGLKPAEKALFLDAVEGFRAGRLPLSACLAVLRAWLARFDAPWLASQAFFSPYPPGLVDIADSGKGRDLD